MRVSLIQMDVVFGQPGQNMKRVEQHIERAVKEDGAEVVVLPEMWNTGYDLENIEFIPDQGEIRKRLSQLAADFHITLIGGSIASKNVDGVYNTTYIYNEQGNEIASYQKIHLFRMMEEDKYLRAGYEQNLFPLRDHWAASIICYDVRFPEYIHCLARQGAFILFVPAQWPHPRLHHWRILNQARAIENQMFVCAVNRVGEGNGTSFCGHSMLIDPWGNVLVEGEEEEVILTVDIDLDDVERIRTKIPVFQDRRPSVYV